LNRTQFAFGESHTDQANREVDEKTLPSVENGIVEGPYSIHVASFRDFSRAERVAETLRVNGFPSIFIIPVDLKGYGRWYRVKVGWYDDHQSALRAAQEYLDSGRFQYAQPLPLEGTEEGDRDIGKTEGKRSSSKGVRYE
jgi:cell division protein FtsN